MSRLAPVRIAARASEVAMRQAAMVASLLEIQGLECEVVTVRTKGDRKRKAATEVAHVPGMFTHELEVALAKGRVDCAVHSLKDLPLDLRTGLVIGAVLERDDPRDVLVVNPVTQADDIASLPAGSRVGTSTALRRAQLLAMRRDLDPVELRGTTPERLQKVETGRVHAAILPASAIVRLGATRRISEHLDAPKWIPAPAQGVVAIEIRADDDEMRSIVSALDHPATRTAVSAEREFLAALDVAQDVPAGALTIPGAEGNLTLHAFVSDPRGRDAVRGSIEVDPESPATSARALVNEMATRGLRSLLLSLRASSPD